MPGKPGHPRAAPDRQPAADASARTPIPPCPAAELIPGTDPRKPTASAASAIALQLRVQSSLDGNMAAMRNTGSGLPVVTVNAYGMLYGTAGLSLIALVRGVPLAFDASWPCVASLFYLALAGTSLAFGLYLALIKKIGPARASYTSALFPVVALVVSTIFEGYRWSLPAFIGPAVLRSYGVPHQVACQCVSGSKVAIGHSNSQGVYG